MPSLKPLLMDSAKEFADLVIRLADASIKGPEILKLILNKKDYERPAFWTPDLPIIYPNLSTRKVESISASWFSHYIDVVCEIYDEKGVDFLKQQEYVFFDWIRHSNVLRNLGFAGNDQPVSVKSLDSDQMLDFLCDERWLKTSLDESQQCLSNPSTETTTCLSVSLTSVLEGNSEDLLNLQELIRKCVTKRHPNHAIDWLHLARDIWNQGNEPTLLKFQGTRQHLLQSWVASIYAAITIFCLQNTYWSSSQDVNQLILEKIVKKV